jgi:hypothetical protein
VKVGKQNDVELFVISDGFVDRHVQGFDANYGSIDESIHNKQNDHARSTDECYKLGLGIIYIQTRRQEMQKMVGGPDNIDEQNDEEKIQHGGKPEGAGPVEEFRYYVMAVALGKAGHEISQEKEDVYGEVIIPDAGKKFQSLPSSCEDVEIYQRMNTENDEKKNQHRKILHWVKEMKSHFDLHTHIFEFSA